MCFFKQLPRKIRVMKIVSRAILIVSVILAGYFLIHSCEGWWLYFFDHNLNYIIVLVLFLVALLIEIISFFIQKKTGLPLVRPIIRSIVSWGLFLLFAAIVVLFMMPGAGACSWSRDAKIISGMSQARTGMVLIYEGDGNFDRVSYAHEFMKEACEQVDMFYRADKKNIPMFSIREYTTAYEKDGKEPVTIHDSSTNSQKICIYSPLNVQGYWYCVDSTGRAVKTKINPASPGYCIEGQSAICPP